MNPRLILSKTIGLIQIIIGGLAIFFAFFLFYNILNVQDSLGFSEQSVSFYLWGFIIFGLLSLLSGLFLFYER